MKNLIAAVLVGLFFRSADATDEYFGALLGANTAISGDWRPADLEVSGGFQAVEEQGISSYVRFLVAPVRGSAGFGFGFGFSPEFLAPLYTVGMGFEIRGWYNKGQGENGPEIFRLFTTLRGRPSANTLTYPEMNLGIESFGKKEKGHFFFRAGLNCNIDRFLAY